MKRLVTLINQLAAVSVTTAAFQMQADNANKAAEKFMKENEVLKQVGLTDSANFSRYSITLISRENSFFPFCGVLLTDCSTNHV